MLDVADDNTVRAIREKKNVDGSLINAGYMVLKPAIFDYLTDDTCVFEQKPMQLAADGQLMRYTHKGFWQCMDTVRERQLLEKLYAKGTAPWKKWRIQPCLVMMRSFFAGKRVFLTRHAGFEGSWLCKMLVMAGAQVTGYSLEPPTDPDLFPFQAWSSKFTA